MKHYIVYFRRINNASTVLHILYSYWLFAIAWTDCLDTTTDNKTVSFVV